MKIAVVASNGRVGNLIAEELQNRGEEVVGFARGENKGSVKEFISKDALSLTKDDLLGFDAVVDAIGGWTKETIPAITDGMIHLATILEGSDTRLYVVGGAGSLFVNKEHTVTVDMGADFPESWKPLSAAHGKGLRFLRESKNLNWVYLSPACNFVADGGRTGEYQLGGEELILILKGDSSISYADYAIAMADIIESGKYDKVRLSVVSK